MKVNTLKNIKEELGQGIYLKDSGVDGNTTTIMVGVHGNEISGIEALNEIINDLDIIKGKVYFIYANLKAIEKNVRYTEKNLNRCFLKDILEDTYEERRAKEIMSYLDLSDYLLDIHNTESLNSSLEMLITSHKEYIKYFTFDKVIMNIDDISKGGSDGYMDNIGKKGFCIECGSFYFGDKNRGKNLAKDSIYNFLKVTGNIEGNPVIYNKKREVIKMYYLYITQTSNFKLKKQYADFEEIKKAETVAYDSEKEIVCEKNSTIIFAHNRDKIGEEGFYLGYNI